MAWRNRELAASLQELADLMKLEEGGPQGFRVRAYEKAAGAIRDLASDVAGFSTTELQTIDGVGKSTALKIEELIETGTMARLVELRTKYPPEFVELTRIPGLGPRTVVMLRDTLGIENVEQLRMAIDSEALRDLPGLGARSEEKISRAIERLGLHGKDRRTPIIQVLPVAKEVVAFLEALPAVSRAMYCGSLRRFRETIADVDIVAVSRDPAPVMDAFASLPMVAEVIGKGDTKASITTNGGLQVDLRVVTASQFGAAVLYFTGSKQHNIVLRQRAIERGLILNEYGLTESESGRVVASRTEKAVYAALDLPYVAPELREGAGEIEAAESASLPRLVEVSDIRGDLHVHSDWSGDGRSSLAEMVEAAARRGLEYIAITEHGEDLSINGLSRAKVRAERKVIAELRERHPEITILHGAELNIDADGGVDYDPDFLAEYDWCVASVHSQFDLPQARQTERLLRAIANSAVNVIGHLTGRRIGKRPGIDIDAEAVFAAAAETGTGLEINCHLDRLDVPPEMARLGRDVKGLTFVISTDSHHTSEYVNIEWGVRASRRGWVDKRNVANTWPAARFLRWAGAKRSAS